MGSVPRGTVLIAHKTTCCVVFAIGHSNVVQGWSATGEMAIKFAVQLLSEDVSSDAIRFLSFTVEFPATNCLSS